MRFVSAAILSVALSGTAHAAAPIIGDWVSQDGKGVVTIAPCGKMLCGHISRITEKGRTLGPTTDEHNPDPAQRTRSLIGVQVLFGFKQEGDVWHGSIYYPHQGKTYRAYISRNPDNSLKVQGCWYFICRTVKWPTADGVR
jgi:uncharacterized protein (DUF2147 family)